MTRTPRQHISGPSPQKKTRRLTNAERCKAYRAKILADPTLREKMRADDCARAKTNRLKPKTPEEIEHQRQLQRQRQKRYEQKLKQKKAAEGASGSSSRPQTRLDKEKIAKKREANNIACHKHRANWTAQKRRRVNEKRMARYYQQKEEARLSRQARLEKGVQAQVDFQSSDCPYPTQAAFKRAVRRVRSKIRAKGKKFAFLFKGLIRSADSKTKSALKELNITVSTPKKTPVSTPASVLKRHVASISKKRDKATLQHKRCLGKLFQDMKSEVGLSERFIQQEKDTPLYVQKSGTRQSVQKDIRHFFEQSAVPDPCKIAKKMQLLKPVSELHKEFVHQTKSNVSLRSFYRHKPKNVASVNKIKFRQCMCEICLNPKLKLSKLNSMLVRKCESVRELLNESLCKFEDAPALSCVDRKCSKCGVERVETRLKECLENKLEKHVTWRKWENVKKGKSSGMEKTRKSGTVSECLNELLCELGPLSRHVLNAEWQRKQLQSLKAQLPVGWAMATCDFAQNFLCRFQDEPQSAHWSYKQVTVFPVVAFSRCKCGELMRDSLVFLSDDLRHDAHFAQVCVQQVLQYLSGLISDLRKVVLISDGCAAQFKSKVPFLFLSNTAVPSASSVEIEKVFFGARHAKNDSDWCGGAVKRAVTRDIASGRVTVGNARDMFRHCHKTLSQTRGNSGQCQHKAQNFFLIEPHQLQRKINSSMLRTVPGSRKIHHLRALAPGALATRQLSCFCSFCMNGQYQSCSSKSHVDPWEIIKLNYSGPPVTFIEGNADETEMIGSSSSEPELPSDGDTDSELPEKFNSEGESPVVSVSESEWSGGDDQDEGSDREQPQGTQRNPNRVVFFRAARIQLAACTSFQDVQVLSHQLQEQADTYAIPEPSVVNPLGCRIDNQATNLLPPELQGKCFALAVAGDGNCFFRALSVLLFGREEHHEELRVRVGMAMALNPELFLDGRNWCSSFDQIDPSEILRVAILTSVAPDSGTPFEDEVMSVVKNGTYTGLWEFFAVSYVLKRPVQSVFPPLGWDLYRLHCNRIIRAPGCVNSKKLMVMWTSLRADVVAEHWVPNHFVPIVLQQIPVSVPKLGSFHIVQWHRVEYVGQVLETDELLELACISFMRRKQNSNLYYWPPQADYSWEPIGSFIREVSLRLVEEASSQRCQFFSANAV